jgi:hypothetical protein
MRRREPFLDVPMPQRYRDEFRQRAIELARSGDNQSLA